MLNNKSVKFKDVIVPIPAGTILAHTSHGIPLDTHYILSVSVYYDAYFYSNPGFPWYEVGIVGLRFATITSAAGNVTLRVVYREI